jgi:competence protein ComEA
MSDIRMDRRGVIVAVVGLLVVLALGGRLLLHGRESASAPPLVRPATPSRSAHSARARLFVHVVGAVRHPGLYTLAQGSRVADAVARAGGVTRKAQIELVNLAAPLADGEQILVPRRGMAAVSVPSAAGSASSGPVHLSTATMEQLDALPGVGPVTAQKILDYRQEHGAFGSVDELDAVPGIGPARLEELRKLVAP